MTNNCQSCTHSLQLPTGDSVKLFCTHIKTERLLCENMPPDCKHYEYEAGTDALENK